MPRVLICSVGGSPAPIINAITQNSETAKLDLVLFLCSSGEDGAGSDQTIEHATTTSAPSLQCPHCKGHVQRQFHNPSIIERARLQPGDYEIVTVDDPDALGEVLAACDEIDERISARWPSADDGGDKLQVLANYTGGTKTMSLGIAVHALQSPTRFWELQLNIRAAPGRPNLVRLSDGDMALPQDISLAITRDTERLAEHFEKRHDYEGAAGVLAHLLRRRSLPREQRALVGLRLARCQLQAALDRFDYPAARRLAGQIEGDGPELAKRLKRLLRTLELVEGHQDWNPKDVSGLELVDDILANAQRCAERQRFDDAVGRLYRATELLAQIRLRRTFGLHVSDLKLDDPRIPQPTRERLEAYRRPADTKGRPQPIRIGLFAAYELLADLSDPLGTYFTDHLTELHGLMKKRNHSFFAHGLSPIGSETAADLLPRWRSWLDRAKKHCI